MTHADFDRLEKSIRRAVTEIESLRARNQQLESQLGKSSAGQRSRLLAPAQPAVSEVRLDQARARLRDLIERLRAYEQDL
ncbi:MAG TPA: hypothetical protein VGB22_05485 [candidate division Zixibacteria bacterium]|jgi:cell division septum initiation protein DivIVA